LAPSEVRNPVLTDEDVSDCRAASVATPFMLKGPDRWHMFFEVFNLDSKKGEIGWATSEDAKVWNYQQLVLAESFHLSYPYVFEWKNEYYMIPEGAGADAVRLYKAVIFPTRWALAGILLRGKFAAPSIVGHDGNWWIFAETDPEGPSPSLRLYRAEGLLGPWTEHPSSPIVKGGPCNTRSAGRIILHEGSLLRFAQDSLPDGGTAVRAFTVTEQTQDRYSERACGEEPILSPIGTGWNGAGVHHLDPHRTETGQWIACVDGIHSSAGILERGTS